LADNKDKDESRVTAKNVGVILLRLRKEQNLSQEALAEKADCHTNNIGLLERGERTASIHTLKLVAEALGYSASDILKMAGY